MMDIYYIIKHDSEELQVCHQDLEYAFSNLHGSLTIFAEKILNKCIALNEIYNRDLLRDG